MDGQKELFLRKFWGPNSTQRAGQNRSKNWPIFAKSEEHSGERKEVVNRALTVLVVTDHDISESRCQYEWITSNYALQSKNHQKLKLLLLFSLRRRVHTLVEETNEAVVGESVDKQTINHFISLGTAGSALYVEKLLFQFNHFVLNAHS